MLRAENDEVLMIAFKEGNEEAFNELVLRYKNKLFNYIYKYVRDSERSEEITQEVFIRVYRSRDRYQVKAKFSTFIYRIAINLSFNEVRNKNRRKTDLHDEFDTKILHNNFKDTNTPESIYERKETSWIIHEEISKLSPKHKDVLLLCDMEGFSYRETAKILNISIGTVQSRLSRGRIRLKQQLEHAFNLKANISLSTN